ncbi:adenosylcobalamin-dependent ribonucleoside-diphosphate reductase [Bdellovibrionota bacterium FG-2]
MLRLTKNAKIVFEKRFLRRDAQGRFTETPEEILWRVASFVATGEGRGREKWARTFFEMMQQLRFLPNTPTLLNAGRERAQLAACFVLPIEDSLGGIFETLKCAALIHQSGGGTGFSFSNLRPKGSAVRSTAGVASGPVSFLRIFDTTTETIKQGGARRGANMGVLRVDHPDIFEFIQMKAGGKELANFNLSVGVTDAFMSSLKRGGSFSLGDPATCASVREVSCREVFDRIVLAAWESGDPGVVFLDRMNGFNPTPSLGDFVSTNPCGEQPLLAYESCNLGSLNLIKYKLKGGLNWEQLATDVAVAVRFLDNVVDLNSHPVEACRRIAHRNRKIGLGVMGFADLLLEMGIYYDSAEARSFGERVMAFIDREAKRASAEVAEKKGCFKGFSQSLWRDLGYPPLRNATVTTVAPTGTLSLLAGVSSGIEPIFGENVFRNVLAGERLSERHPHAGKEAWCPASKVSIRGHVEMQAVFQRFSDSAVSKTVNLKESAGPEDVAEAYWMAFLLGCKGISVYRDRSRSAQVIEHCSAC